MTLIASFRCSDGGVLLCADREQSQQIAKRSVDKIFRIPCNQGTFLIAGAGRSSIVDNTFARLETAIKTADANNVNLFDRHQDVIGTVLHEIHEEFIWGKHDEYTRAIKLIVTASFVSPHSTPFVYGTDEEILYPHQLYGCAGVGQDLAYYFADKLYNEHLSGEGTVLLAAFIFREVSHSVSGVGLGTDMQFLAAKGQRRIRIPSNKVQELESGIPDIEKAIADAWNGKISIPDWLTSLFT
jgi:20S proteasome alpha/beta subunit